MKKISCFLLLLILLFPCFNSCDRNGGILVFVHNPPDTSSTPSLPYTIKVSKYYDSLFATAPSGYYKVQDFDIYGDYLYIWAYFTYGLYEYHLNSKTLIHISPHGAGDCIAADSGRVYWAWFGESPILLFNIQNSQTTTFVSRSDYEVSGLQVHEKYLYVLYHSETNNPEENLLDVYSRSGVLTKSISYPRRTYYMAINRGILYSVARDTVRKKQVLSRFELSSRRFLTDVENPSLDCDGIRSYGDYFFFTDYEKDMIGYVHMDEIEQRGK